jgi:translocation and assembly module TamA
VRNLFISRFLLLLAVFLLAMPHAFAQTTARVGERQRYQFELQAPPELTIVLTRYLEVVRRQYDDDIDDEQLIVLADRALRQARSLLQTEGYFSPDVEVNLENTSELPHIIMKVTAGTPVRIVQQQLTLIGVGRGQAENFYEARRLDEKWQLSVGQIFRQEPWEASKSAMLREFRLEVFPNAKIAFSEARVDIEKQTAELRIEIDVGEPIWFGEMRLQGLSRYPDRIVTNQYTLLPGQAYSQARLAQFQAELLSQPYFSNVSVQALLDQTSDGRVPVLIELEEVQRRKITLGAGYSSNTGIRAQAGYNDLNLAERGWRLETLAKLELRQQSLESKVSLPRRADGWEDGFRAAWTRSDIEGLDMRTSEVVLRRSKEQARIVRAYELKLAYSLEQVAGMTRRSTRAVAPGYDWTYRSLDSLIYPREGYWLNLQAGIAAKAFLSDQNFIRTYGKYLHYWPVGADRDSLQLRFEGGAVLASSRVGIPQEFLFRAGGDQSLRGYDYQSLGVREGAAVVGTRYLAIAGLEYTRWFSQQWGVGLFTEAGNAFDQPGRFRPVLGLGAGPRWRSPLGPVNVDMAYGERERQWRLHFSLGLVF